MLAKTESVALIGTEAHLVEVEVDVGTGVPRFTIVGLPSSTVREADQRVRSAILSSSESWPQQRITANLAPGALRKEGTHFDLPLAFGVLAASGRIDRNPLEGWIVVGELALDGSVRPVRGTLAAAIACRESGRRGIICPAANAVEASLVEGIEVVPVRSLRECIDWAKGTWTPEAHRGARSDHRSPLSRHDRSPWSEHGQGSPRDCGRRRSQLVDVWSTGVGQDDARQPASRHPSCHDPRGIAGGDQGLLGRRFARRARRSGDKPALQGAASPHFSCWAHRRRDRDCLGRERSASLTWGCFFLTSFPFTGARCSRACESRSSLDTFVSHEARAQSVTHPGSP